jgi:[protein-PII] uridylyltransferase
MSSTFKNNIDLLDSYQKKRQQSYCDAKNMIMSSRYNGIKAAQVLCKTTDDILIDLIKYHFTPKQLQHICFVAIGGYGRGLLAPYSDIDLCIMTGSSFINNEESIRNLLYDLWDLKLKIGYSVGTIHETISGCETDIIKRTAHLERRFLFGNHDIFQQFFEKYKYLQTHSVIEFTNAKLKEREERHQKSGNSRYLVEPDVKNGKGGIRDINAIMWITQYRYQTNIID